MKIGGLLLCFCGMILLCGMDATAKGLGHAQLGAFQIGFVRYAGAAIWLALYIALAFDLPRPYWAMAAVYVVANPLAGATSSKGLYRALGTLIGAAASVVLLPMFVNSPLLLSLVVSMIQIRLGRGRDIDSQIEK